MSVKIKKFGYSLNSSSAINCNLNFQDNITNKGLFLKEIVEKYYDDSEFSSAVPCNGYYITVPLLDKISILGNPNIMPAEKIYLNNMLFQDSKLKIEKQDIEWLVEEIKGDPYKRRYKYLFHITNREHPEVSFNFYFEPMDKKARYLKMEFSPWKCRPNGVKLIRSWYEQTVMNNSFDKLIKAEQAVNKIDIAFDIIGLRPRDLLLNYYANHKSNRWHSVEGELETYYPLKTNKKGVEKPTNIIIYHKNPEILNEYTVPEKDDDSYKKAKLLTNHTYYPFLKRNVPITRIEKRITPQKDGKKGKSFLEIATSTNNSFGNVKIPFLSKRTVQFLSDGKQSSLENSVFDLYLEAIRNSGNKEANKIVPSDYKQDFFNDVFYKTENILSFLDTDIWKELWGNTCKNSGLV